MLTIEGRLTALRPSRESALQWATLLQIELAFVLAYILLADVVPTDIRHYVYPFVWINASIWAVDRVDLSPSSHQQGWLAAGIGVGYFLVLGYAGGVWALGGMADGLTLAWLPPGWGPAVIYSGDAITARLMPFKLIGYAALAYLVAATVLDTITSGVAGLVALFSCVSCTWPVAASVFTGIFGSASAVTALASTEAYGVSTLVFLLSIGMLVWQPRL